MSDKSLPENFLKRRSRDEKLRAEADKLRTARRA
jgi:hypothetical protein